MTKKQQLFIQLNAFRAQQNRKPLKAWKQSIKKLEETVEVERKLVLNMGGPIESNDPVFGNDDEVIIHKDHKVTVLPKIKVTIEKKPKISEICREHIALDKSNNEIHEVLLEAAQTQGLKYNESKKWYITWYRSDIKRKAKQQES